MSSKVISAQKKRALEALERRFSKSKPELPQMPYEKKKKREKIKMEEERRENDGGRGDEMASTSTPDHGSSLQKGSLIFQGKFGTAGASGKDSEGSHPAYRELSLFMHQNLIKPSIENRRTGALIVNNIIRDLLQNGDSAEKYMQGSRNMKIDNWLLLDNHVPRLNELKEFKIGLHSVIQNRRMGVVIVNNIIHDLLQNGDSAEKYMQGSRNMKIDNWLLLDNHVPRSNELEDAQMKSIRSRLNRSKKHMSMRQHRAFRSFELHQIFWKFDLFKPMHEMWKEYILKLLDERRKHMGQVFLAADLHGAFLQVVECKGGSFTGVGGIVIRETKGSFGVITPEDQFKVVVKKLSSSCKQLISR